MSIDEMLNIARLSMHQVDRTHAEDAHSPKGLSGKPGVSVIQFTRLSPNDWTEGPQSLMSLGDMLCMA
eukprot:10087285-Karenia_brevis.AAC.1